MHTIQIGVMSYAADHDGAYPVTEYVTYTADRSLNNLGNRYLDTWPRNPWTGKPMANTGSMVLFNTDFASMAGLNPIQNTWKVVNGVLVPPVAGGRLAFGDTSWTDVQLDVNATLVSGANAGYGVYFRSDGKPNITGYCFQFDPGAGNKFTVRKVNNGAESGAFQTASMPPGFSILGTPHDITIKAVGNHFVIKVDGAKVLDFTDSTFASGSAGFRTWGSSTKVSFNSAKASSGNGAGSGAVSKGDFAHAYGQQNTAYGLVGWMAGNGAFVVQPLD